jgi:sortase A
MFKLSRLENWRSIVALSLLLIGLQQVGSAAYIKAKANLAQVLIGQAWGNSLAADGVPTRPWPWADTWPVARLEMPQHAVDLYVLSGSTGNALAFGPGYEIASAKLGGPGLSVIGGHRDTHFSFLREVEVGSRFFLQVGSGERLAYRVTDARIVDVQLESSPAGNDSEDGLLLVTCYPFDALLAGGSLRYVVNAVFFTNPSRVFEL